MCAEPGENGASVPFLVVADCGLVNTPSLRMVESNAAKNVNMVMVTKTRRSAILTCARLIVLEIGKNTLLVPPAVVVESSLACTKSPKKPRTVAKFAQR
jgi:hypothetical protein